MQRCRLMLCILLTTLLMQTVSYAANVVHDTDEEVAKSKRTVVSIEEQNKLLKAKIKPVTEDRLMERFDIAFTGTASLGVAYNNSIAMDNLRDAVYMYEGTGLRVHNTQKKVTNYSVTISSEGLQQIASIPLKTWYPGYIYNDLNILKKLDKVYANDMFVLRSRQKSALGVLASFRVRLLNTNIKNHDRLTVYTYDDKTGDVSLVLTKYLCSGGYMTFSAPLGHSLVISDEPLQLM